MRLLRQLSQFQADPPCIGSAIDQEQSCCPEQSQADSIFIRIGEVPMTFDFEFVRVSGCYTTHGKSESARSRERLVSSYQIGSTCLKNSPKMG